MSFGDPHRDTHRNPTRETRDVSELSGWVSVGVMFPE
jgi:hypothetical protein